MSVTLWTGPLPKTVSTRTLVSSRTRAMSEPKTEVAPPAGAVITVTVFSFIASRSGIFHVSFGPGVPAGGPACGNAVPDATPNMKRLRLGENRLGRRAWRSGSELDHSPTVARFHERIIFPTRRRHRPARRGRDRDDHKREHQQQNDHDVFPFSS